MKRVIYALVALAVFVPLAAVTYFCISPYHAQLRTDFSDPAKREAALSGAITFEKIHVSAMRGDARAEYRLGRYFATGDLGIKDDTQASLWFRRAADQAYGRAVLAVGYADLSGDGGKKDEMEGAAWVKKAADAGVPEARDMMGALYAGGIGEKQDMMEGLDWLKRAQASEALALGQDLEQKLKAAYAVPPEQRDAEVQKVADGTKTDIRAKFPTLLATLRKASLSDPADQLAEK